MASPDKTSTHVTFRIATSTRQELDAIAELSQRPLAQLIRNAVELYLSAGLAKINSTVVEQNTNSDGTVHVGVRLTSSLLGSLNERVLIEGRSMSQILRSAVESWLSHINPNELGALASVGGHDAKN